MKTRIALFVLLAYSFASQAQNTSYSSDAFLADYKSIAAIYEQNLTPYLYRFAEMQYKPLVEGATEVDSLIRKRQIEGTVHIHKTNFRYYLETSLEYLQQEGLPSYATNGRKALAEHLEFGLKTQFMFLDYHYYEKTASEVSKLN